MSAKPMGKGDEPNRNGVRLSSTYVCYSGGGAAKFKELAEKKGKMVINLFKK